jgi:hypothetical protein
MTRSGLGERPFEQCPVMAGLVAKVGDRAAVASQLTQPDMQQRARYQTPDRKALASWPKIESLGFNQCFRRTWSTPHLLRVGFQLGAIE